MPLKRPGVLVEVSSLSVVPREQPSPSNLFLVGYAPWGPVNKPVFVGDVRQARVIFGEPSIPETGMWIPRILDHYLRTSLGTGRAWVVRGFEVGTGKTLDDYTAKATLSATSGSTTTPVLKVKAAWPGALGNQLKVDVIPAGPTGKRIILWGRYGPEIIDWVADGATMQGVVNEWNDLADAFGSDFRLELVTPFVAGGPDYTTTTNTLFKPSSTAVSLTGGRDGETSNFPLSELFGFGSNGQARGLTALADDRYGPGIVVMPGYALVNSGGTVPTSTTTLVNQIEAHCRQFARLGIITLLPNGAGPLSVQDAVRAKQSLPASSYVAYYYPRVYDDDNVLSPVEGFVAGVAAFRMAQVNSEGGIKASVTGSLPVPAIEMVAGREPVGDAEAELLYLNQLNYIRFVRGIGYRLESQLLSAPEGAISRLHHRNIANYFKYMLTDILQQFRDRTIDATGRLQMEIQGALLSALDPYGPGKTPPNGNTLYNPAVVVTGNSIQNEADLNQGLLHVYVEASFSPKAERIQLLFNVLPVKIG